MNEIEKRIHRGMNQLAPDVFQNIVADNSPKLRSEAWLMDDHKSSQNFWMRAARTAAVLAACCVLILGLAMYQLSLKVDSVVEIDVNPSLELQVNRSDRVVRLNALNADGVKILDDVEENLKRAKLDEAIHVLVNTMVKDGFLNEEKNSVLVSVSHGDAAKSAQLQQMVADNVKEALDQDKITGVVYKQSYNADSTISQMAEKYGISPGKAAFIKRLIILRPDFSIEDLAKLSISEITELLERERVDVSDYIAKSNGKQEPEGREEPEGTNTDDVKFAAKVDGDSRGNKHWIETNSPCLESEGGESSIDESELEDQPADGVIENDEKADSTQQIIGPTGNGIQVGQPENQGTGGGSQNAGGTDNQPGNNQGSPDIEENPGTDTPVEEEPGDSDEMGSGSGTEDPSQWEDVTGIPMILCTQIGVMTEQVDSLLAQIANMGLLEEEGIRNQAYKKNSAQLVKVRIHYELVKKQVCEMHAAGELNEHQYQKTVKIFKQADKKLVKAERELKLYVPVSENLGEVCPDGK